MTVTDAQVRKLMDELRRGTKKGLAAARAGMDPKTARKYAAAGKLPSELRPASRSWRTRRDPFEEVWPELKAMLEAAPELQGKALFGFLQRSRPGDFEDGQLRTLQRRIRRWRAQEGPPKEVFFPQDHRPGEILQTDFTVADELGVTIAGESFPHRLCNSVLTYSGWQCVTVCASESFAAVRAGLQEALARLGRTPKFHQIDNSTAATHNDRSDDGRFRGRGRDAAGTGRRFNVAYLALVEHYGIEPRAIEVGCKEQNGSVEASNGALKNRLHQHLAIRGDRDFPSREAYIAWLDGVVALANENRRRRHAEDLAAMRPVTVKRLPEFTDEQTRVKRASVVRVDEHDYSVPSRLIREKVDVRIFEGHIEVRHAGVLQEVAPRRTAKGDHHIRYQHVIASLIAKPGAFERYRYRRYMYPRLVFRQAYDALVDLRGQWAATVEYLQILKLAADRSESEVATALELLIAEGEAPRHGEVLDLIRTEAPAVPEMPVPSVDLSSYDRLIGEVA